MRRPTSGVLLSVWFGPRTSILVAFTWTSQASRSCKLPSLVASLGRRLSVDLQWVGKCQTIHFHDCYYNPLCNSQRYGSLNAFESRDIRFVDFQVYQGCQGCWYRMLSTELQGLLKIHAQPGFRCPDLLPCFSTSLLVYFPTPAGTESFLQYHIRCQFKTIWSDLLVALSIPRRTLIFRSFVYHWRQLHRSLGGKWGQNGSQQDSTPGQQASLIGL